MQSQAVRQAAGRPGSDASPANALSDVPESGGDEQGAAAIKQNASQATGGTAMGSPSRAARKVKQLTQQVHVDAMTWCQTHVFLWTRRRNVKQSLSSFHSCRLLDRQKEVSQTVVPCQTCQTYADSSPSCDRWQSSQLSPIRGTKELQLQLSDSSFWSESRTLSEMVRHMMMAHP